MFKTLRRWFTNLKWLFNHPPLSIAQADVAKYSCDYCGRFGDVWHMVPLNWSYCMECQKRVYDSVLLGKPFTLPKKVEN